MSRIMVTPDKMDYLSQELLNVSNQIEINIDKLDHLMSQLNNSWESETGIALTHKIESEKQHSMELVKALNMLSSHLQQISMSYREAESIVMNRIFSD